MLFSRYFGASATWDAFSVAFRTPNLFRRLFGEGALTAAFLPSFIERYESGKTDEARALLSRVVTSLALFLSLLAAIGFAITYALLHEPKTKTMAALL
jgi:putative peptidoglycan lipid II flippase